MSKLITPETALHNEAVGGKAKNLAQLNVMNYHVPAWTVIPEMVLRAQLSCPESPDPESVSSEAYKLSDELLHQLALYFGPEYRDKTYAVRSSAIEEDNAKSSFAGQFETFLHVPFEDLGKKIIEVWKSAFSERVRQYRKILGLSQHSGIAVIVQEMVVPEVSGVGFGMDPITGEKNKKVIASVYGLGEGIVSGALNADNFAVTPDGIEPQIATKEFFYAPATGGKGLQKRSLPSHLRDTPSLNEQQLTEIAEILQKLEHSFGAPQDIEFAYSNGEFILLQSRPITGRLTQKDENQEYIIWDNSNIVESYPGITTPLTFSFIEKMYEQVYRQFLNLMGVPQKTIDENRSVFANTLGLVRGRVYYNLLNWYKMLAMLPAFSLNAPFMEKMMGVKERFDLKEDPKMTKSLAWYRLVLMVFKILGLHFQLPRKRRQFKKHLDSTMASYHSIDFSSLSPKELINHYRSFQDTLLLKWKAPLINDFFAMIWYGVLEKKCQKICPDQPNLHNDLLCGSRDIISVQPIKETIAISESIRADPSARQRFETCPPGDIWTALQEGEFPQIKQRIDQYLHQFGERCVGELKLETISYNQNPVQYIQLLSAYVEQDIQINTSELDLDIRRGAERKLQRALRGNFLNRWWVQWILKQTREIVSNRENLRFERTRAFGMVRKMFRILGEKWMERGQLKSGDDVFYLKLEEILQLKQGELSAELLQKIEERKSQFDNYRNQPPPKDRFSTFGKNFGDEFIYSDAKIASPQEELKGIGCCPGRVRGKAQIVANPHSIDSVEGNILVCTSTDPGWVKLFPTASAILVERGSVLSHSAIVSREMGIPCIVGVTGLLRSVENGNLVEIDGGTGEIKILSK